MRTRLEASRETLLAASRALPMLGVSGVRPARAPRFAAEAALRPPALTCAPLAAGLVIGVIEKKMTPPERLL